MNEAEKKYLREVMMQRYRIMHGFKEYNPNGEFIYYDDHLSEIERAKMFNPCGHTGFESVIAGS